MNSLVGLESEKHRANVRKPTFATPSEARSPTGPRTFIASLDAHHDRVGTMARRLARRLGLQAPQARLIGDAAARHDTGKLYLRREVFEVPRPLTAQEMTHVRAHTVIGHAALSRRAGPGIELAARVALQHHEHWDGGGYPFGLRGEEICIEARIVAVCDVYDALREERGYKRSYSHAEAMTVMLQGDERTQPTMFDPAILSAVVHDNGSLLERVIREAPQHAVSNG